MTTAWTRRSMRLGVVEMSYLEAGEGSPLVLLHGGEFGGSAEITWGDVIGALADRHRVIAPDILGFGESAKVVDFVDGRGWRLRHLAGLCTALGVDGADFMGNSMGGAMLLADAVSESPVLPMRRLISVCGGGESESNDFMAALMEYDATMDGMQKIVTAMFHDPSYADDRAYVSRRYESSVLPGAWEAVAAARFRRPGHQSSGAGDLAYERIAVPTLLVEGEKDKLKPAGWAQRLADRIPGAVSGVVPDSGHCPQIEQPEPFLRLVAEFLSATESDDRHW